MRTAIRRVLGRRIWDSRGRPTVEAEVVLADGTVGRGIAPAGASRGSNEAVDLRDGGAALDGYGVGRAVDNLRNAVAPRLLGLDARDQGAVDAALLSLDRSDNKSEMGGNTLIAASMAALNAAAASSGQPLWRYLSDDAPTTIPLPEVQIFGGGAHAGRRVDVQDFLVMPVGADTFDEAMVMVSDVYRAAGRLLAELGPLNGVADEGGWWPSFASNEQGLEILSRAIDRSGHGPDRIAISLDIAASEFGGNGRYRLALEDRTLTRDEWTEVLRRWIGLYPILSLEDPFAEDDREGMIAFTAEFGHRVQIIGDDYLVTDADRVREAASDRACNAVLVKPNQIGTITAARTALEAAREAGWGTVVSARSGETEDVVIAHLAVGWNAQQLKVGSFTRSERMAKWNETLRIEESMGADARYAGLGALPISRSTAGTKA